MALKVLKKSDLKKGGLLNQMKREIWIQSLCKQKNILQIYGFFFDTQNIFLILEYANDGDLYSLLKKQVNCLKLSIIFSLFAIKEKWEIH